MRRRDSPWHWRWSVGWPCRVRSIRCSRCCDPTIATGAKTERLTGMIDRQLDIQTTDGAMTTFIYHPTHEGPHPVVLYLMDAPSIRPALKDMATRLASAGYYVMLPYLFYRGGP